MEKFLVEYYVPGATRPEGSEVVEAENEQEARQKVVDSFLPYDEAGMMSLDDVQILRVERVASKSMTGEHVMGPKRLSASLRRLAVSIDRANRPSRAKVAAHLRQIIAAFDEGLTYTVEFEETQDGSGDSKGHVKILRSDGRQILGEYVVEGGVGSARGDDWDVVKNDTELSDATADELLTEAQEMFFKSDVPDPGVAGPFDWSELINY